jgi:hypothetical protein
LLHEQPHGRLLAISKAIANKAVVQARSVLQQLPEGNRLLERCGYLESFEVAIHIAIKVDSSVLDEAHDCDGSERPGKGSCSPNGVVEIDGAISP